jgi:methyl-accepting chemotaxis protein
MAAVMHASFGGGSARSLRRRLVSLVAIGALIAIAAAGYAGLAVLRRSVGGDADARIRNAAVLSQQLVQRVLAERSRQVELMATAPSVIEAAKAGAAAAREKGLPSRTIPELEAMFKATRSQQVDPSAHRYLSSLLPTLDVAEIMVTDAYGYNAVTTSPSSDFVQSDEAWWKSAWTNGMSRAQATADPATGRTVVELAGTIRDGDARLGVVKVKVGLSLVDSVLAQGAGGGTMHVDLVDSTGRVIASSTAGERFARFGAYALVQAHEDGDAAFRYDDNGMIERGAVASANDGRWRVIAHMSDADASQEYFAARRILFIGLGLMILLVIASLYAVGQFIERRITGPADRLAAAADAVAAGDLFTSVDDVESGDEIGRLSAAMATMIDEMRRMARALNRTSSETTSMSAEITASTEQMAASAGQIAHTAADLSQQANVMAETIQALAGTSERLAGAAGELDAGAREGVARNERLRTLALDNRARLDGSSRSLSDLNRDAEASAKAIEELAAASEEVRSFVTLVQKLARQSKLLALNAAMEAARAGEHGHGFAVVAEEVRRLAATSSDAAERTEAVVSRVLHGVAQSRSTTERTVETVRAVRGATEEGSRSFGAIEQAVAEADAWTSRILATATSTNGLAGDMRTKLDSLSAGTESFAAAMEEVAASSEQQSASTEQIAAAASTLAAASDRLSNVVANLRLEPAPTGGSAPSGPRVSGPYRPSGPSRMTPARASTPVRVPAHVSVGRSSGGKVVRKD